MRSRNRRAIVTLCAVLTLCFSPGTARAICGDGFPDLGELCDDANLFDGDGCDSNCTPTACGNGITTLPETCDDANLIDGDGCDSNCTPTACGNGVTTAPETCDDGNLTSGDGCDANCTPTACGNGVTTAPETCDDGNLTSGDGCDANCTATACGNGVITAGETCDDTNLIDGDGCDSNCTPTACGNGVTTAPESCDDANLIDGDGCDSNCTPTACGNGVTTAPESCDDANLIDGDGCDSNCTPTACGNGVTTTPEACDDGNVLAGDGCRGDCTIETCGDGTVDPLEGCDDGNLISGDGCDANCTATGCGNGVATGGEQCDDSNLVNGDGCSASCLRELLNPVPAEGDHFGHSLAPFGTNLIVGVPLYDKLNAINTGLVYLYSSTTFQPIRTFQNPDPNPGDEFGYAVAAVGSKVLVGAPYDDATGTDAGAAYLFDGTTGALLTTYLNPNPAGNRHFGQAVAALGSNVLIGAPLDDAGVHGGGVVYLFNAGGGQPQQVYLNPTPAAGDTFGHTIAILGTNVVVGAPGHDFPGGGFEAAAPDAGAVYIFDSVLGTELKTIGNPLPATNDHFGSTVAVLGADLLIGVPSRNAGAVDRINADTGELLITYAPPAPGTDDLFGISIVTVGGNKVVVGASIGDVPGMPIAGVARIFDAETGALLQTLSKNVPASGDEFGYALAVSGSHIAVGAPLDDTVETDAGAVYFFADNSCGNGTVDPTEQCDDANFVSGDGCDDNCTTTACGNNVVTAPEQCDDGNTTGGDGCNPLCGSEGACGDGMLSPFEQCDDGNLTNGDGCDGNCTVTGCGNALASAPEECDHGSENGIDLCCSLSCQLLDADGDDICDRDDVCPNSSDPLQTNTDGDAFGNACDLCPADVNNDSDNDLFCTGTAFNPPALGGGDPCSRAGSAGAWIKPRVSFSHLGVPQGDDQMRLKAKFTTGSLLPIIAPHINGIRVRVIDKNGGLIVDEKVPGGAPTPASPLRGWKKLNDFSWKYGDKAKPAFHNGIEKITIKQRVFVDPFLFTVEVKGNLGTYGLQPGEEPIRVSIELNADALPAGGTPGRDECGEVQFLPPPGTPSCKFTGFKLACK